MHVANRWLYAADNGLQLRWGFKATAENRLGGSMDYRNSMRDRLREIALDDGALYGSQIRNRGFNGYVKLGMPVGAAVYDKDEQDEMRSNIAFVADFDHFDESSYFGLNDYSGNENSVSLNAMYSHYFTYRSSLIMGVSAHLQSFNERLVNDFVSDSRITGRSYDLDHDENEAGLYAEYTYAVKDRFSLVAAPAATTTRSTTSSTSRRAATSSGTSRGCSRCAPRRVWATARPIWSRTTSACWPRAAASPSGDTPGTATTTSARSTAASTAWRRR